MTSPWQRKAMLVGIGIACALTLPFGADSLGVQRQASGKGARPVLADVQHGIASGNVSAFSSHFSNQIHITLRGGESGLYSASQAYYLLQNYFHERKPVSFTFTTFGDSDTSPYATGSAAFNIRGNREYAQVYVALGSSGERWVITHINIY